VKLHEFKAAIEALHSRAEAQRLVADDFQWKNVLAAEEVAYEKVLELYKQLVI
jgi:hypothetical protein